MMNEIEKRSDWGAKRYGQDSVLLPDGLGIPRKAAAASDR
jgi:hypothetical protein